MTTAMSKEVGDCGEDNTAGGRTVFCGCQTEGT